MGSSTPTQAAPAFRSPPRILIPKLVESRDKWKAKAGRRKKELKKAQIRARDLAASRKGWKERALAAEQEFQALRQQHDECRRDLEAAQAEVARLTEAQKKGPSPNA